MKKKYFNAVLGFFALLLVVVLMFVCSSKTPADAGLVENELSKSASPINSESNGAEISHEKTSKSSLTSNNEKRTLAIGPPTVTEEEIASNRYFPAQADIENLDEYVDNLLNQYKQSPNAETAMFLRRALSICEYAPRSQEDVDKRTLRVDKLLSKRGGENAHAGIVRTSDSLWNAFYKCKEIAADHPEINFDVAPAEFLRAAADTGNGLAAVELALGMEAPPNFRDLEPELQASYKEKVGKLLLEARNNCEPGAMFNFAHNTTEGEYWYDQSNDPPHIKNYANQLAMILFYENNVKDVSEKKLRTYKAYLESIVSRLGMTQEDVAEAQRFGRSLYEESCLK